jgi:hypothetical protein
VGLQTVQMWRVVCDHPECGRNAHDDEGSDYSAWTDQDGATIEADANDWLRVPGQLADRWYCRTHRDEHDPDRTDDDAEGA